MNQLESITKNQNYLYNRAQLQSNLRCWFQEQEFIEITTPIILSHSSLEENINPLTVTYHDHNHNPYQGFLRVSPELSLKKILASSKFPKIYELGPCFRDLESKESSQHLVEFTLLEWYHYGINLKEMMKEFIHLIAYLCNSLYGCPTLHFNGKNYNLGINQKGEHHWKIISIAEAFYKYAKIDFSQLPNWESLISLAQKKGFSTNKIDDAFYWLFLNFIEPHICNGPTIIYEYPIFQASFSQSIKKKSSNNLQGLEYGLRFEAYLGGMEICNAFQELINPKEQKIRWENYLTKQNSVMSMDEDFLTALCLLQQQSIKDAYPNSPTPTAGVAMGWERLLMFLLQEKDIRCIQPLAQ